MIKYPLWVRQAWQRPGASTIISLSTAAVTSPGQETRLVCQIHCPPCPLPGSPLHPMIGEQIDLKLLNVDFLDSPLKRSFDLWNRPLSFKPSFDL